MTHSILLRPSLPPHARTPKICRLCVWHKGFCALRPSVLLHDRIREHWLTVNFGELLFFFPFLCQICDGTRPAGAERCFPPQEGGVDAHGCLWCPVNPLELYPCSGSAAVNLLLSCVLTDLFVSFLHQFQLQNRVVFCSKLSLALL